MSKSLLGELQEAVSGAAGTVGPAVVGLGRGWGRGSGVVVGDGRVLTCAHVLRGDEVAVTFGDGRTEHGRVAGADAEHGAPLPRGSSGGPLVDPEGHLLGLNAVRREGGLILAVPADEAVRTRVAALARGEAAGRPRLGVALASPRHARRMRSAVGLPEREGLLVRGIVPGSAAERAGLERGDLLVRAGGRTLASVDDLFDALDAAGDGTLALGVVRGSDERDVDITLE